MAELKYTIGALRTFLAIADLSRVRRGDAADYFSMSETTLARRLRSGGHCWCGELEAERQRRFMISLNSGDQVRTGPDHAAACGYRETNSFYRAFRSWYGMHFSDFRRQAIISSAAPSGLGA